MIMAIDPDRFIQEKLSKKTLSINTVRDGVMAALLITLQKKEEQESSISDLEAWRRKKAIEIRIKASAVFAEIDAPFEYPTLLQIKTATDKIKKSYDWDRMPNQMKSHFETLCQSLFAKF